MIRGTIIKVSNGPVRLFSADGRSESEFENREFFQHYGMSSRPLQGAENIIIRSGNHFVSIADGDRRYQIELQEGEVAIHDDLGQTVHLTREGIVIKSAKKISLEAPDIELTGSVQVVGTLEVTENIVSAGEVEDGKGSMQEMRDAYRLHTHNDSLGGGTTPPEPEM